MLLQAVRCPAKGFRRLRRPRCAGMRLTSQIRDCLVPQIGDEPVDRILCDMLHDDNMRQLSAKRRVLAASEIIFPYDFGGRTAEYDRVAIFIVPIRPTYPFKLRLKVSRVFKNPRGLLCQPSSPTVFISHQNLSGSIPDREQFIMRMLAFR